PVRARAGGTAQHEDQGPRGDAHALLRALRPVRGRHRGGVAPDPPAHRPRQPRARDDRPRRCHPGLDRRPGPRAVQPVLRHHVEVLRLPHDHSPRRPPADPERTARGRRDRRRIELADVPSRHLAAARADRTRVGVPLDHRRVAALRPRVGHHQGRPDRRLVDDGDVPLRALPRPAARLRERSVGDHLRTVAARRDPIPAVRHAPRPAWERDVRLLKRVLPYVIALSVLALVIIPLAFAVFGGFRTNRQLIETPVGLPDPWNFDNYRDIVTSGTFWRQVRNSVVIALLTIAVVLPVASLASFALARYRFRGR